MDKADQAHNGRDVVEQTIKWLNSSAELGHEAIALKQSQHEIAARMRAMAPGNFRLDENRMAKMVQLNETLIETEKRFEAKCSLFLVSLNKAARWVKELKKVTPDKAPILDSYLVAFAPGKDIRDIREHDDEYHMGRGRFPEKLPQTAINGLVQMTALSTLIVNGEILIGGVISVQGMLRAVEDLRTALHTTQ